MLRENIEDHGGAVNDLNLQHILESPALRGRKFRVCDNGVSAQLPDDVLDLLSFTFAKICGGIGVGQALNNTIEHLGSGSFTQRSKLFQGIFGLPSAASVIHTDQHHFFESKLAVLNLGDVLEFGGKSTNPPQALSFFTV
jgi:hypothetical protein